MHKRGEKVKIRSDILLDLKMDLNMSREKHLVYLSLHVLFESEFGSLHPFKALEWVPVIMHPFLGTPVFSYHVTTM